MTSSLLKILREKYSLYALSNTNVSRVKIINESLLMGLAKPDKAVYKDIS